MVAAYLFLAAYLALAQVGSQVLPPPPPPALAQLGDPPAEADTSGEQPRIASARP
jgi:hypothetical protein